MENATNTVIQTHGMTTGNIIIGINLRVYQWSNTVYYHEMLFSCHSVFTLGSNIIMLFGLVLYSPHLAIKRNLYLLSDSTWGYDDEDWSLMSSAMALIVSGSCFLTKFFHLATEKKIQSSLGTRIKKVIWDPDVHIARSLSMGTAQNIPLLW